MNSQRRAVTLIAVLASTGLAVGCSGSGTDGFEDRYRQFASAVENHKGHQAVKSVSSDTLEHYAGLKQIALYGNRNGKSLPIYDEVAVCFLRASFDAEALKSLSDRDVYAKLVNADITGVPGMSRFELTDLERTDNEGWGVLLTDEVNTRYIIGFDREGGKWLIDDSSFRTSREEVLLSRIMTHRGTRSDVINALLKSSGIRQGVTPELEQPLVK